MYPSYTVTRIRRPELAGVSISLAIHLLALYLLSREDLLFPSQPPAELTQPLSVSLIAIPGKTEPEPAPQPVVPPPSKPQPRPKPATLKPPPAAKQRPPAAPDTVVAERPEAPASPPPAQTSEPVIPKPVIPKPAATLDPGQFPDMISYLEAVRQKRREAGEIPAEPGDPPPAKSRREADDAARLARIQRNLQQSGTNGIFQISSIDARTATFSFRGWKGEYSYSRREEYLVEAGFNQDIRRVVIRKMIEIIRRYHSGDFNWESPRLGRIVPLSA
ncbi:MAG: hypothetical protein FGM62_07865, partial [Methylobacterium sp.]|nr:hypothetical protein [Methylobacterium sp.]